ncbi:hypothetical protein E3U44_07860 [Nitrosococcus wardiae]|uniref:Mutator family transposase n=1 Tax=Nitrosococcus wardiae TaxID=1814290 RepID=A0A4P7BWU1_9GAMM|nr:hypothetical protein E3U44_07860 [Nitrosococcus wardiae]
MISYGWDTEWYLPERTVQIGIGDTEVKVSKVCERSGSSICFNSTCLPPYLKRARSIDEWLTHLYLKGVLTDDYQKVLAALLGEQAKELSADTLKSSEEPLWRQHDLSQTRPCVLVGWWHLQQLADR